MSETTTTSAPVRCFACGTSEEERTRARAEIPTVAVFVHGGLVQDVCFSSPCRVIVIDSDCDEVGDATGAFVNPDSGRASYVGVGDWTLYEDADKAATDAAFVRAAIKTADDPWHAFRDNEEERARVQRELEGGQ